MDFLVARKTRVNLKDLSGEKLPEAVRIAILLLRGNGYDVNIGEEWLRELDPVEQFEQIQVMSAITKMGSQPIEIPIFPNLNNFTKKGDISPLTFPTRDLEDKWEKDPITGELRKRQR